MFKPNHQVACLALALACANSVYASPRGSEFDITQTSVSGAMAGVGEVRATDPVAMIFGNPATLTQLKGENAFNLSSSLVLIELEAENDTNPAVANPFAAPGAAGESELDTAVLPGAGFSRHGNPAKPSDRGQSSSRPVARH